MKNKIIKMFSIICITLTSLSFVKADLVGNWSNSSSKPFFPRTEPEPKPNLLPTFIIAGVILALIVICFALLNYLKNKNNDKK